MTDRYESMTSHDLVEEMVAWQAVADAPKGPGGPSNGARKEAIRQMRLAEAWYHRKAKR
jgi:hypothetical protein